MNKKQENGAGRTREYNCLHFHALSATNQSNYWRSRKRHRCQVAHQVSASAWPWKRRSENRNNRQLRSRTVLAHQWRRVRITSATVVWKHFFAINRLNSIHINVCWMYRDITENCDGIHEWCAQSQSTRREFMHMSNGNWIDWIVQ